MLGRAKWNGQRSQVRLHRRANLAQQRHHRRRTADAIEAHDVGAGIGDALAGIGDTPIFARHISLVHRQRDDGNLLGSFDDAERDQCFLGVAERFADHEIDVGARDFVEPVRLVPALMTCSPKSDPGVMRVNCPRTGKETLDEAQETFPGTGGSQAS